MGNYVIQSKRPHGDRFVRDGYAEPMTTTSDVKLAHQWVSEGRAVAKARTLPAAEVWHAVELDASGRPLNLTVASDDEGLYVEVHRTRFRGSDLPGEGTSILSASTFSDERGRQVADIEWSGDSPTGRCTATVQELG